MNDYKADGEQERHALMGTAAAAALDLSENCAPIDIQEAIWGLKNSLELEKHVNYRCYLLLDEDGRMETGIHIPDEAISMVFDMMRECRAARIYQLATGMSIAMYECGVMKCDMCKGTKTELVVKYEDKKEVSREERPCSFCNAQGWRLIDERNIDNGSSD